MPTKRCPVSSSKRSRFDLVSEAEMNAMKKGYIPRSMEKTTRWAVINFLLWKQNRNVVSQEAAVPDDILDYTDPAVLSHWLSCFVAETRTTNGTQYPPNTIYSLLAGIQRHMKSKNADAPTFLNKEDNRFKDLHNTLDVIFRGLGRRALVHPHHIIGI